MNRYSHGSIVAIFFFLFCAHGSEGVSRSIEIDLSNADFSVQAQELCTTVASVATITSSNDGGCTHAEILYLLGIELGTPLESEKVAQGLAYLSKKKKFSTARITCSDHADGTHLHIDCHAQWTFGGLTLHGPMLGKRAYYHYYRLQSGDPFDEHVHEQSVVAVQQAFYDEGFVLAQVTDRLERDERTKTVYVHIDLLQGEQFFFGAQTVHIDGVPEESRRVIERIAYSCLDGLAFARYNKQHLNDSTECIHNQCRQQGLWVTVTLQEHIKKQELVVEGTFTIKVHTVCQYHFVGNSALSAAQLLECLAAFGPLLPTMSDDWIAREVERYYRAHGFSAATVSITSEPALRTLVIHEGERAQTTGQSLPFVALTSSQAEDDVPVRFGKTIMVGDCCVAHRNVLCALGYKEGDVWDIQRIKQTIRTLKSWDVFETVHMYPADMVVPGYRPMILNLNEDDPYEVRLRLGAGLDSGGQEFSFSGLTYKVGAACIARNITSRADQLRFDFDMTRTYRKAVGLYKKPWMGQWPVMITGKAYSNAYQQPSVGADTQNLYTVTQNGILWELATKHSPHEGGFNIGFEADKISLVCDPCHPANLAEVTHALNFTPLLQDQYVPYFVLEPTLFLDYVDDKLRPRSGMTFLLSAKTMIPLGSQIPQAYFMKVLTEQTLYASFNPLTFALRLRAGYIFYHTFSSIMPIERFYLGGAYSIRSYQTDMCPPLGRYTDKNDMVYFVPQGGKSMICMNTEIRFPLILPGFEGVVFQDIGALGTQSLSDFIHPDLVTGTGFGVRYNTPVGTARFDVGFKWNKHMPEESNYAITLVLGQAF